MKFVGFCAGCGFKKGRQMTCTGYPPCLCPPSVCYNQSSLHSHKNNRTCEVNEAEIPVLHASNPLCLNLTHSHAHAHTHKQQPGAKTL